MSSGQAKETFEQTTAASDMEVTSEIHGQTGLCPGQDGGGGTTKEATASALVQRRPLACHIRVSPGDVVVTRHVCVSSITWFRSLAA
ncbi:hypothetical protein GCM10010245_37970 [Streptomyces spectabilis]|nr:hypothetical protein GCM10010245_37970 [Streptomyces spectabilis]